MRTRNGSVWIVGTILCVLLICASESLSNGVQYIWTSLIVYPALRVGHAIATPLHSWYYQRVSYAQLQQERDALQHELEDVRAQLVCLQSLLDYTQQIQEQIDFKRQQEISGPIVQILMKQCTSQGHFFWIDAGASQGVVKDMVAVYRQHLLGKVVEVYPWYSKVQLITDASCKVAGYCASTNIHGIHKGCNSERNTVLTYVSHLDTVHPGDQVFSSGEGLVFPRGLLLGHIVSVKPDGLYQQIEVKTDVDLQALRYCMLIDKGHKSL